jgi:CheY-like chemotaxis protein
MRIIAATCDIAVADEAVQGFEVVDRLRICYVDLILLEMTMPGISGVDLACRRRAIH